jgi:alcohol dehydrogenase (NADP+)
VILAWAVNRGTIAIPKSARPDRLRSNLDAATIELDDEDMAAIAKLDRHYRFVDGKFWELSGGPYTVTELWDE